MANERLESLAALIGQPLVNSLCEALGGTRIYVPRVIGHNHPIVAAIGLKAATILAENFHSETIDLPKAHLRRARMLEFARSGRMTIKEAALACDYTERRLYQLLAAERIDDGQLDLFATNT